MTKTLIIAEAGVNHNGDIQLAKQLIDAASEAGVDYVKFQTFKSEKLVSKNAEKAKYQKENTGNSSESQLKMLQKLELSEADHLELITYCKSKDIKFLSTAFDLESIDFLNRLNIDLFKVPSGEITNYPYLEKIGSLGKPIIISTGMATIDEIGHAMAVVMKSGTPRHKITVLHCNTEYPTPMHDVNLNAMQTIAETYGVPIGYSDHTLGIEVPTAAVALGATVIEKHFTLDKTLPGPDHKASLEPNELKAMVIAIRNIESALGDFEKEPTPSELKNKSVARKSIVANTSIKKGDVLTKDNITTKRPGNGISAMEWPNIIDTTAKKDYLEDDLI
tara:strand:+ start:1416 stop:2417 length:1002 start_codon:yes stop_codon:yes gene_type:complete